LKQLQVSTRYSARKRSFLTELARDLVSLGGRAKVQCHGRTIYFFAKIRHPAKQTAIAQLKAIRNRRLVSEAKFIYKMEKQGIGNLFANGRDVHIHQIKPAIRICRTRRENEIFHYCRLLQSFPTANLIGRQLRVLVFDEGQDRPLLMGAIGLSSSPYSLSCRDKFLHWDSKRKGQLLNKGLDALMQLAVCMSWPPYSYLLGGKLMAALALSKTVADEYELKYKRKLRRGTKLQGLTTICAGGTHCPIFHRIMLRPGGLYRRVGETSGYTTAYFSQETMNRARRLVESSRRHRDSAVFGKSMRIIKSALRICDLPYEQIVKNGLRKGVYLGFASSEAAGNLREGRTNRTVSVPAQRQIVEYWQNRLLPTRLCRRDIKKKIQQFKGQMLLLGLQVNQLRNENAQALR